MAQTVKELGAFAETLPKTRSVYLLDQYYYLLISFTMFFIFELLRYSAALIIIQTGLYKRFFIYLDNIFYKPIQFTDQCCKTFII